jgi:antitoxin (DNA-binding transcriptional repressor) of toxin-antitoxin stability system
MKSVSSSEFRSNASAVLDLVENGEIVQVVRHGKAIAKIIPFGGGQAEPAWKRPGPRIVASGASLSKAVVEERKSRP